jgi:Transposase
VPTQAPEDSNGGDESGTVWKIVELVGLCVGSDELVGWASALGGERLWAIEDCWLLTPWLERQLLGLGEELVRVSPKLTVPERRAGRTRGKSHPIDALAVARAALREPDLPRPQPGERVHREIKLLVDHRDDLVDERRRTQQRLRWHLHELDPTLVVPLRRLDRASHLERVGRWLARREQEVQVRIARELVTRIRSLTRASSTKNSNSGRLPPHHPDDQPPPRRRRPQHPHRTATERTAPRTGRRAHILSTSPTGSSSWSEQPAKAPTFCRPLGLRDDTRCRWSTGGAVTQSGHRTLVRIATGRPAADTDRGPEARI